MCWPSPHAGCRKGVIHAWSYSCQVMSKRHLRLAFHMSEIWMEITEISQVCQANFYFHWWKDTISRLCLAPSFVGNRAETILNASLSMETSAQLDGVIEASSPKVLPVLKNHPFTGFNTEDLGDPMLNHPECVYSCRKMTKPFRIVRAGRRVWVSARTSAPSGLLKLFFSPGESSSKIEPSLSAFVCREALHRFAPLEWSIH